MNRHGQNTDTTGGMTTKTGIGFSFIYFLIKPQNAKS